MENAAKERNAKIFRRQREQDIQNDRLERMKHKDYDAKYRLARINEKKTTFIQRKKAIREQKFTRQSQRLNHLDEIDEQCQNRDQNLKHLEESESPQKFLQNIHISRTNEKSYIQKREFLQHDQLMQVVNRVRFPLKLFSTVIQRVDLSVIFDSFDLHSELVMAVDHCQWHWERTNEHVLKLRHPKLDNLLQGSRPKSTTATCSTNVELQSLFATTQSNNTHLDKDTVPQRAFKLSSGKRHVHVRCGGCKDQALPENKFDDSIDPYVDIRNVVPTG
eukprot:199939_1